MTELKIQPISLDNNTFISKIQTDKITGVYAIATCQNNTLLNETTSSHNTLLNETTSSHNTLLNETTLRYNTVHLSICDNTMYKKLIELEEEILKCIYKNGEEIFGRVPHMSTLWKLFKRNISDENELVNVLILGIVPNGAFIKMNLVFDRIVFEPDNFYCILRAEDITNVQTDVEQIVDYRF